jgi:hypothetical protein
MEIVLCNLRCAKDFELIFLICICVYPCLSVVTAFTLDFTASFS